MKKKFPVAAEHTNSTRECTARRSCAKRTSPCEQPPHGAEHFQHSESPRLLFPSQPPRVVLILTAEQHRLVFPVFELHINESLRVRPFWFVIFCPTSCWRRSSTLLGSVTGCWSSLVETTEVVSLFHNLFIPSTLDAVWTVFTFPLFYLR